MTTATTATTTRASSTSGSGLLRASASVLVHDVLTGPVRPATVVATSPHATYVDVDGRFLAVVVAGGVQLPCAAMLAPGVRPPAGPHLGVGEGAIHERGRPMASVRRWFDPRVRLRDIEVGAVDRLAATLTRRSCEDVLLPTDGAERLAGALTSGDIEPAVASLIGRGTGSTPAGDDLLAGALAALRAWGSPAADGVAAAARRLAPGRTTRLSIALLEAADLGAVVPEAGAVLRALSVAEPLDALEPATDDLIAIGNTSGWHLAAGLMAGAAHVAAAQGRAP